MKYWKILNNYKRLNRHICSSLLHHVYWLYVPAEWIRLDSTLTNWGLVEEAHANAEVVACSIVKWFLLSNLVNMDGQSRYIVLGSSFHILFSFCGREPFLERWTSGHRPSRSKQTSQWWVSWDSMCTEAQLLYNPAVENTWNHLYLFRLNIECWMSVWMQNLNTWGNVWW